jgi:LmbE family N-acetylglucosaminyl deacetylase
MSCCEGSTTNICLQAIKYCDHLSERWVWSRAPMRWHRAIDLQFRFVKLEALEPAGSLTRPDVLENWVQRLFQHKSIPPLIVCATPAGKFYVIDGNHRLEAIQRMMGNGFADTLVRVAEIVPKAGYHFRYRWMNSYGTYVLEPVELGRNPLRKRHSGSSTNRPVGLVIEQVRCELEPGLRQLLGRTLFVLAHPDDETACAALLQRTRNPVVLFCTDGAPASEYFWGRYGSRDHYAGVRKKEAETALAIINVNDYRFLTGGDSDRYFSDQDLYRDVAEAFQSLQDAVKGLHIQGIVAPAYEGGHPDHDTCGFLANLLGRKFGVPVWETPLYHRSQTGELVHQQFTVPNGSEVVLRLTAQERAKRAQMLSAYASQPDAGDFVKA